MGALRCMRGRAGNNCHPTKMQQEIDHLNQMFQENGFTENPVKKTLTTLLPPFPETPNHNNWMNYQDTVHPLHHGAK